MNTAPGTLDFYAGDGAQIIQLRTRKRNGLYYSDIGKTKSRRECRRMEWDMPVHNWIPPSDQRVPDEGMTTAWEIATGNGRAMVHTMHVVSAYSTALHPRGAGEDRTPNQPVTIMDNDETQDAGRPADKQQTQYRAPRRPQARVRRPVTPAE